jgi:hypothetical protein
MPDRRKSRVDPFHKLVMRALREHSSPTRQEGLDKQVVARRDGQRFGPMSFEPLSLDGRGVGERVSGDSAWKSDCSIP